MRYPTRVLVLLLVVHAALLGSGAVVHSPTIDEFAWLPSGMAHWRAGRVDLVVNHPPHVGMVAAIPLLLAEAELSAVESPRSGRSIGGDFVRANGHRSFWLFTLGRWACIPFSIAGAIGCFAWARDLYGPKSGSLSAALWCFSPNILTHGQLVSHDVPAASFGLLATYAFWRWLRRSDWMRTIVAGLALGVALLTKMTMLLHLAVWPLAWVAWRASDYQTRRVNREWIVDAVKLAIILAVAIDLLNVGYGFQGSFARLDSYSFRSEALAGPSAKPGNRFAGSFLGQLPVPFPRAFVKGVDFQRFAVEGGLPFQFSYLRGEWSTHGWPYYYLYAAAVKVPLGTWCLMALSLVFRIRRIDQQSRARDEMVLLVPAIALLVAASASLSWTDHLRYILPSFPFVFIWISRCASLSWTEHRWLTSLGAAALAWSVTSSLWVYPHSMSYFNESVGGPSQGHYHLLSSNIDYGQDLLSLKRWYDAHPTARPLGLAYWDMESIDPEIAGIEYFVPPTGPAPGAIVDKSRAQDYGPQPGWYAINVNLLHGDAWPGRRVYPHLGFYGYFLEFTPVARAGYSIYVYHVTVEDANRVRRRMGLPPIVADGDDPSGPTERG